MNPEQQPTSTASTDPRVIAVTVAYAEERDPVAAVERLAPFVDHVILVDNTASGHPKLAGRGSRDRLTILANANKGGLAGAYNAALERVRAAHPDATHVLFLDDDTDTGAVASLLGSAVIRQWAARDDVAATAPAYVDRATGIRVAPIQLSRFRYRVLSRQLQEPTEVAFLINSMSLWRVDALRHIGSYDERLAVDHVDTDYCLRAGILGYKLVLNPAITFQHSIGTRRKYELFGRTLQSGGHSPARREMIGRNTVVLARRYGRRYPAFAILCLTRLLYECLGIVIAEDQRASKLWSLAKGTVSGALIRQCADPGRGTTGTRADTTS
jgi:rhamnosyltransferase